MGLYILQMRLISPLALTLMEVRSPQRWDLIADGRMLQTRPGTATLLCSFSPEHIPCSLA